MELVLSQSSFVQLCVLIDPKIESHVAHTRLQFADGVTTSFKMRGSFPPMISDACIIIRCPKMQ